MGFDMIFIFLLALILFGPKRLPKIAREIGKFVAEFKRASNDFKYQLQNEIENAGTDAPAPAINAAVTPAAQPATQQTSSFTQTLLPPSVKSAISNIDTAHDRLMKTARMAFEAQNFTLNPPATAAPVPEAAEAQTEAATPAESDASNAQSGAAIANPESSPVEAANKASIADAAPTSSSAPQNS
jgi:sec-independent protein translocase protein TatB